jgi:tetratricopeptide (TPR) repeat protein
MVFEAVGEQYTILQRTIPMPAEKVLIRINRIMQEERSTKMGLFDVFTSDFRPNDKIRNTVPDDIKKHIDEALAETQKGNFDAAITIYKRILPDYPDNPILRNNVGCCLAHLEKFDDAETEFIEALRLTKLNREKGLYVY